MNHFYHYLGIIITLIFVSISIILSFAYVIRLITEILIQHFKFWKLFLEYCKNRNSFLNYMAKIKKQENESDKI